MALVDERSDIGLVGLDHQKGAKSPTPGVDEIEFMMNGVPGVSWKAAFATHLDRQMQIPPGRQFTVVNSRIILHAPIGEVKAVHFPRIQESIAVANNAILAAQNRHAEAEDKERKALHERQGRLKKLSDDLGFQ
jgi:hypothetical protein